MPPSQQAMVQLPIDSHHREHQSQLQHCHDVFPQASLQQQYLFCSTPPTHVCFTIDNPSLGQRPWCLSGLKAASSHVAPVLLAVYVGCFAGGDLEHNRDTKGTKLSAATTQAMCLEQGQGGAPPLTRHSCWSGCTAVLGHQPVKMVFRDQWRELLLLFWFETWCVFGLGQYPRGAYRAFQALSGSSSQIQLFFALCAYRSACWPDTDTGQGCGLWCCRVCADASLQRCRDVTHTLPLACVQHLLLRQVCCQLLCLLRLDAFLYCRTMEGANQTDIG